MRDDIATEIQNILDEFSFFDDWADRYQHLIDLGRRLPNLPVEYQKDENKLAGCQSVVWFVASIDNDNLIQFQAQSDAAIVQGLVALMLRVYSGRSASEIVNTTPDFLAEIGLDKHLSPTRKNGLASMVTAIKSQALHLSD